MMEIFTKQFEQLSERKKLLRDGTKAGNTICDIIDTEEKILNLKATIKEMRKKMHTKQKQIVDGHEEKTITRNANLLKQLEQDYIATQSKISQMKLSIQAIYQIYMFC